MHIITALAYTRSECACSVFAHTHTRVIFVPPSNGTAGDTDYLFVALDIVSSGSATDSAPAKKNCANSLKIIDSIGEIGMYDGNSCDLNPRILEHTSRCCCCHVCRACPPEPNLMTAKEVRISPEWEKKEAEFALVDGAELNGQICN